jgi:hypothetical protein
MVSVEKETERASSRAGGARRHHPAIKARACSFLLNCSALRGKAKPRSSEPTGVSDVEVPRRGVSTYHVETASHNRRPLSNALLQKGWPPWSWLFVDVSVSTPPVAESSTSASTATVDKFAVGRGVVITTAGLNAVRRTAVTRANPKANVLVASVKQPTAYVRPWLERGSRQKK